MTTAFPADQTQPFVAENGVTYIYSDNRWRVKNYEVNDSKLQNYLPLSGGNLTGTVQTSAIFKSIRTSGKAFEIMCTF